MATREPLTEAEKQYIYQRDREGQSLKQLAHELVCAYATARKWWRHQLVSLLGRWQLDQERGIELASQGRISPQRASGTSGGLWSELALAIRRAWGRP